MSNDEFKITIEATDEADALALKKRIEIYLETLDNGDYSGRVVEIEKDGIVLKELR